MDRFLAQHHATGASKALNLDISLTTKGARSSLLFPRRGFKGNCKAMAELEWAQGQNPITALEINVNEEDEGKSIRARELAKAKAEARKTFRDVVLESPVLSSMTGLKTRLDLAIL